MAGHIIVVDGVNSAYESRLRKAYYVIYISFVYRVSTKSPL